MPLLIAHLCGHWHSATNSVHHWRLQLTHLRRHLLMRVRCGSTAAHSAAAHRIVATKGTAHAVSLAMIHEHVIEVRHLWEAMVCGIEQCGWAW